MKILIGAFVVFVVLFIIGCAKVSGECSRMEEKEGMEDDEL